MVIYGATLMRSTNRIELLFPRSPLDSSEGAIKVEGNLFTFTYRALMSALVASGFRQLSDHPRVRYFLPCSVGTFSNSSSKGTEGCTVCPPGKSCSDKTYAFSFENAYILHPR